MRDYDIIVVGAGHAGCEAALAASRLGARTALITMDTARLAAMPCNPSVGGIAKSHLVFEIDALGGEMARNADFTGIQFRTLNTRKGPAVRANRAQCDKHAYSARMKAVLERTPSLTLLCAEAVGILARADTAAGVKIRDGAQVRGKCVVLAPGTALGGTVHIGAHSLPGGGDGRPGAHRLSASLKEIGILLARLKTGTPPRLYKDSIRYDRMTIQPGQNPPPFFSWAARRQAEMFHVEHPDPELRPWPPGSNQLPCYTTHTTAATHDIIRTNLKRSALYSGAISGTGVRYCPSIEDKIVKFPDKSSHHLFLEPEGRETNLVYPNGTSNSLPEQVQADLIHSIPGLEEARIAQWAYAIEYDFADPTQLSHTLESKFLRNLFLAGQINGTTGYEEAAAQGVVAGVNAVRNLTDSPPFTLSRSEAYIGVLIDDLVTKGTDEPYRMLTSRAEHRLLLRQDNARYRLLGHAANLGLLPDAHLEETETFAAQISKEMDRLHYHRQDGKTLARLLRQPGAHYADLPGPAPGLHLEVTEQVEIQIKYQGYIEREQVRVEKAKDLERRALPDGIDYWQLKTLRHEAREKLSRVRPATLGQAARIPGISPADIAVLSVLIHRQSPPAS